MSFTNTTNMTQRAAAALREAKAVLIDTDALGIGDAMVLAGVERDVHTRALRFYFTNVPGKEEHDATFTLAGALGAQCFSAQRIVKILIIDYLLDLIEQGATV